MVAAYSRLLLNDEMVLEEAEAAGGDTSIGGLSWDLHIPSRIEAKEGLEIVGTFRETPF
jgi:hypothetical protein